MKCTVPGANVKIVARAIHSLAKIGEDLYWDAGSHGLSLRTMNLSRSAFATYVFKEPFFGSYELNSDTGLDFGKCKVSMKSAVWAFKSVSQLEKAVESASIEIEAKEAKVKIQLRCKHSVVKTYTLNFLESESIKVPYNVADCGNHFTANSKILTEAALNFLQNQEEVTMKASKNVFLMKNYVDNEDDKKAVHTVLSMQPEEFDRYTISKEIESGITYCLKELRSIIGFADAFSLPLSAAFDEGGMPIIFSVGSSTFEADLVMATMEARGDLDSSAATDVSVAQLNPRQSTQASLPRLQPSLNVTPIQRRLADVDADATPDTLALSVHVGNGDNNRLLSPLAEEPLGNNEEPRELVDGTPPDGTPPSKKAKFFFTRCFDATFRPSDVPRRIFAPDSDED